MNKSRRNRDDPMEVVDEMNMEEEEEVEEEEEEEEDKIDPAFSKLCLPGLTKKTSKDIPLSKMISSFRLNLRIQQFPKYTDFNSCAFFIYNATFKYILDLDDLEKKVMELLKLLNQSVKTINKNQLEIGSSSQSGSSDELAAPSRRKKQKKIVNECIEVDLLPDDVSGIDMPQFKKLEDYNAPVVLLNKAQRIPDLKSWEGYLSIDKNGAPLNISEFPHTVSGMGVNRFWNLITDHNSSLESDSWVFGVNRKPRNENIDEQEDQEEQEDEAASGTALSEDEFEGYNYKPVEFFADSDQCCIDLEYHCNQASHFARKNKVSKFVKLVLEDAPIGDTLLSEGSEIACGLQKADEYADPGKGYDCNLYFQEIDCFKESENHIAKYYADEQQTEQEASTSSAEPPAPVDSPGLKKQARAKRTLRFITKNRSKVDKLTKNSEFDIVKYQKNVINKLEESEEDLTIQQITNCSSFAEAARNFLSVLTLANKEKVEMKFDPVRRGQPVERFRVHLLDPNLNDEHGDDHVFLKPRPKP